MRISSANDLEKFQKISELNRNQGENYEEHISRRFNLRRQRGSGCGKIELEDLVGLLGGKDYMLQAKSFSKKSISIPVKALEKLIAHAKESEVRVFKTFRGRPKVSYKKGRRPAFFIGIRTDEPFFGPRDWVMIPLEDWKP